jgi:hypothetical protein
MDLFELDFGRDGFGQPVASGPSELGALTAFLTEDISSSEAATAILRALGAGGWTMSGEASEMVSLEGAVKLTHTSAGPPVYLSNDEFRQIVSRWADFLSSSAPA